MRLFICVLAGWISVAPALAVQAPPSAVGRSYTFGIAKVGVALTRDQQQAYELLEKKLERWLEGIGASRSRVVALGASLAPEDLRVDANRLQLQNQIGNLLERLGQEEGVAEPVYKKVKLLRKQLQVEARLGPILQKALVAEAAYLWSRGKQKLATTRLKKAAFLHPQGKLVSLPEWSWEGEPAVWMSFEKHLASLQDRAYLRKNTCRYQVSGRPKMMRLLVNGFEMIGTKTFHLPIGQVFHLRSELSAYRPSERYVKCEKLGRKHLSIRLQPERRKAVASTENLDLLAKERALRSLVLVEPKRNDFQLYLYTPGHSIDPIPVQKPLRLAEVLQSPMETPIPIVSDAFRSMVDKHQLVASNLDFSFSDSVPMGREVYSLSEKKWYQDWKVWAIAGGVLGSILAVHFSTKKPKIQSQIQGIRIQVD